MKDMVTALRVIASLYCCEVRRMLLQVRAEAEIEKAKAAEPSKAADIARNKASAWPEIDSDSASVG